MDLLSTIQAYFIESQYTTELIQKFEESLNSQSSRPGYSLFPLIQHDSFAQDSVHN